MPTTSRDDGICPSHHFFIILSSLDDSHLHACSPTNRGYLSALNSRPGANNKPLLSASQECVCDSHVLLQAVHNVFHIVGVDAVSLQQTTVAGALHGQLQETDRQQVSSGAQPTVITQ